MADSSYVHFFSEAPLEDIEAYNLEGKSIIDLNTGEMAFIVPVKGFQFRKSLMQEHFNENYLESDLYPRANLKAKIKNWSGETGEEQVTASGYFEIHGVKQEVDITGTINYQEEEVIIQAEFPVRLKDYDIKIPKAVFYNIAEIIDVDVFFKMKPYEDN
jgi:polyisoprenoid-binding protein YceI